MRADDVSGKYRLERPVSRLSRNSTEFRRCSRRSATISSPRLSPKPMVRPGHPEIMRCPSIKKSDRRRPLRLSSPVVDRILPSFMSACDSYRTPVPCSYRGMLGVSEGHFYTVFVSLLGKHDAECADEGADEPGDLIEAFAAVIC